jgi:4-amino-4-deoxy-L-arabinose transferase-like glycosyltransferase
MAIADPEPRFFVDSEQYLNLANNLLDNGRYQDPTGQGIDLFRSPGYAGFLAILLAISGRSVSVAILGQLVLNFISAILLVQIGRELGAKRAGVGAALILLASPNSLFWSVTIMSEGVFAFGLILTFLLSLKAIKGTFPGWGIGIILAILTYVRPIGLYLILIWAVAVYFGRLHWSDRKAALKTSVGVLLTSVLLLAPWYFRNLVSYDEPVFATVSRTTIQSYHLGLTLVDAEGISWEEAKIEVFESGGGLTTVIETMTTHPASFAKVQIKGIVRTILGIEIPTWEKLVTGKDNQGYGLLDSVLQGNISGIITTVKNILDNGDISFLILLIWGMGFNVVLYGLCLISLLRLKNVQDRGLRFAVVLAILSIGYLFIVPGAAGEARFRVPIEPLLAFIAGMFWLSGTKSDRVDR